MRVWVLDEEISDPRLLHQTDPVQFIEEEELSKSTGVRYLRVSDIGANPDEGGIKTLMTEHDYDYFDVIEVSPTKLPSYEDKIKLFFAEHLHTDDEARMIADGCGYFDVRDNKDKWLRIEAEAGDFLILPAGIYHRFTTNSHNYVKAIRFFKGDPVWTPHNRPADGMPVRKEYLAKLLLQNQ